MTQTLRTALKRLLINAPALLTARVDAALHMHLIGRWAKERGPFPEFDTREQLYGWIAIAMSAPITYLEFGVHRGASMCRWLALNRHPDSRFVGFDSFKGLPERWELGGASLDAGHFSTGGQLPDVNDPRVSFVKGWFHETLPRFLGRSAAFYKKSEENEILVALAKSETEYEIQTPPGWNKLQDRPALADQRLVVHCDADLYASTTCVLGLLGPYMRPGTIILFDDFSSVLDDFRALTDWSKAYGRRYAVLGAAHGRSYLKHVAIRII